MNQSINISEDQLKPAEKAATQFLLPAKLNMNEYADEMIDEMDGINAAFQRIKIASNAFEVPSDDPDTPNLERSIQGIVVYHYPEKTYWENESGDNSNDPPDCQAPDAKFGYGDPGGVCSTCAYNKFGSSSNGRGKACKSSRRLFFLMSGEKMPFVINLPPTSLSNFDEFFNASFFRSDRPMFTALIELTHEAVNDGVNTYGRVRFRNQRYFDGKELEDVRSYAREFRSQAMEKRGEQIEMLQNPVDSDDLNEELETSSNTVSSDASQSNTMPEEKVVVDINDFEEIDSYENDVDGIVA